MPSHAFGVMQVLAKVVVSAYERGYGLLSWRRRLGMDVSTDDFFQLHENVTGKHKDFLA